MASFSRVYNSAGMSSRAPRQSVQRCGQGSSQLRQTKHHALAAPEKPSAVQNEGPVILFGQVAHSITKDRLELVKSLDGYMEERVVPLLAPVDRCWQPSDFLPVNNAHDWPEQIMDLRVRCHELSDDYYVVLVGDMITEEALPTYMNMLNTFDGTRDETGNSPTPWGRWAREWTAEENRHGDALNKYMYLSGRVNMRAIEKTIQNLIGSGMNPRSENNPYLGFIYTSFQERATKISHRNTAKIAHKKGDEILAKLCGAIAFDEKRHEEAYQRIIDELFRLDPSGTMLAVEDMMKKQIVMPAHMMNDNQHQDMNPGRNLFTDFSAVAERLGVYTAMDYADILEFLIKRWNIPGCTGLTSEALAAQDFICNLPTRIRRLAERTAARKSKAPPASVQFSWIFDRPLMV